MSRRVERVISRGYSVLPKDTTQCLQWGLNPQPLNPESSTLPLSHCALLKCLNNKGILDEVKWNIQRFELIIKEKVCHGVYQCKNRTYSKPLQKSFQAVISMKWISRESMQNKVHGNGIPLHNKPTNIAVMLSCTDPENFVKGGPTLTFFFLDPEGERIKIGLKPGHHQSASRWLLNIER